MAKSRNFGSGATGNDARRNKNLKNSRSNGREEREDRHHGGDHEERYSREREIRPLLGVDPGPNTMFNIDPTTYRNVYSSSSRVNTNNFYRRNRFKMLNGSPMLGRMWAVGGGNDDDDNTLAPSTSLAASSATSTLEPSTSSAVQVSAAERNPNAEPSAPCYSEIPPNSPISVQSRSPNAEHDERPPSYDEVVAADNNNVNGNRQLPYAPAPHTISTVDISSSAGPSSGQVVLRSSSSSSAAAANRKSKSYSNRDEAETNSAGDTGSNTSSRKRNAADGSATTGKKVAKTGVLYRFKKIMSNVALVLIQVFD